LELKDRITPEVRKKRVTDDQYRVISSGMWPLVPALGLESILTGKPYPLRVLFFVAYNPMVAAANTRKVYDALKKVDFMAISELYMTPTAELADIVLPAKMWLERDEIQLQQADWGIPVRQNVVGQIEERWSDWEILIELAKRMGEDSISSPRHYIESILKPHGVTFEELREKGFITFDPMKYKKYEEAGFATPSGRYELYSNVLEEMGYDPLPHHTEPAESPVSTPELTKEYPLVLTTGGRIPSFFHSEFRQIQKLRRQCPDPIIEIHPDTAKGLDIRDEDWVWIESPRGRVKQRAKLTSGIDPRVVHAQHAWWFPENKSAEPSLHGVWESNINVLTDWHAVDEAMGSASFRALLCKIYKV
jgi:thiosulfate reductase/polysulfide reductase chain A